MSLYSLKPFSIKNLCSSNKKNLCKCNEKNFNKQALVILFQLTIHDKEPIKLLYLKSQSKEPIPRFTGINDSH